MKRILIVDDEFLIRYTLEEGLRDRGHDTASVASVEEALEYVKKYHPAVVLLDNLLEHSVGMETIPDFKQIDEDIQIILMTAYGSVSQAVEAIKKGACDYVLKPFDMDEVDFMVRRCLDQMKSRDSLEFLKGKPQEFTGVSQAASQIRSEIRVLGAIPENLLESELFGYERGAFAGALKTKKGLIELANGGTVFLDDRRFKRIGALEDTEVDVRVMAATNRDLEKAIKEGAFREDLFYRLNVMQIVIPPLRERREDIPALCDYYLDYYNKAFAKGIERVDPDFMRELLLYDWKGNVRELKNIFERCFLFSQGNTLEKHVELVPASKEAAPPGGECYYLKDLTQGPVSLEQEVAALEKRYMDQALKLCNNNLTKAAALLGTTRFSMKRRMERE